MHHVAIMNKSWKLIPKIISREKTIESRWYQTKRAPWNKINKGDTIFLKNSGEEVTVSVKVSKVLQFTFKNKSEVEEVVKKYGKKICLPNQNVNTWERIPKYCILMFLEEVELLKKSFGINKSGFGNGTAWICVGHINKIKIYFS